MAAAVAELRPGVSERELTGVFMDAMASQGVTTPLTQDVARITGDLVAFDAGVVADGYAGEVGRTWPVDPKGSTTATSALHRRWDQLWTRLLDACRPGVPAGGLLEAYALAGEPLPATPIARGLGLGYDDPVIARDLPETAAREHLDPGIVLVVTCCVSDGSAGTLVTHEPILITPDGPEMLSRSPFWTPEHAGAQP